MLVTIALVMGPAVLAGSIAGEKERGVMALLLTTRVTPREIIAGRLTGKLTQVAMALLVGLPAVVALTALAGMRPPTLAALPRCRRRSPLVVAGSPYSPRRSRAGAAMPS